jgi:uncharacterized protein with WD repeat
LKDRSNDDPATLENEIKDKYSKGRLTKEEKMSIEEQRKKAKAYRDRLAAFSKAKVDSMMDKVSARRRWFSGHWGPPQQKS